MGIILDSFHGYIHSPSLYTRDGVDVVEWSRDEMYSIQLYVIKFVSDLRQVGDFLRVLRFPPPIKLTAMI
jgi:hypothetical protein